VVEITHPDHRAALLEPDEHQPHRISYLSAVIDRCDAVVDDDDGVREVLGPV
jgi:hypothetical protein